MTKPINDKIAELYTDVFYFALSRVDNYRDAEDIAQTVMEKAISKTHMLRKETRLKSWVMKIASNEIICISERQRKLIRFCLMSKKCLILPENLSLK